MGTPSDTMGVMRSTTTGARTRNVINIAAPGDTGAAYTFTATNNAPTAATDGFKNFRSQRYLHAHLSGNIAAGGGAKITLWGYNSFAGRWGKIQAVTNTDADTISFSPVQLTASTTDPRKYHIIDVKGCERIAAHCEDFGSTGTVFLYLGVNSF
jgi:hypothetical protein